MVFLTNARLKFDRPRPPFWKQIKKRRVRKRGTGEEGKIKPVVLHPGIIFWLAPTLCLSHHSRSRQKIRRIIYHSPYTPALQDKTNIAIKYNRAVLTLQNILGSSRASRGGK